MVQIIPRAPGLGELLGLGVGQGVQQGVQQQMDQAIKQQQYNKLSQALGFSQPSHPSNVPGQETVPTQQTGISPEQAQITQIKKLATNPQAMMMIDTLDPTGKMSSHIQTQYSNLLKQEKMQQQVQQSDKKLALTETKDIRAGIDKTYSNYRDTSVILDKMKELDKSGKLTSAAMAKISEKTGIPLSILSNPESEEFQKLSQNLMRGVTQYGNRILQVEFDNFMKQIPTLMNSSEGRKKIINNMEVLLSPAKLEYEAKKQILKENKGIPPLDLYDQIQERVKPEFEKLVESSKSKITEPESRESSKKLLLNGSVYNIPKSKLKEFLKEHPGAKSQ